MSSFLFNVALILLATTAVIQFCTTAFAAYASGTQILNLYGNTLTNLEGISVLYNKNIFIYCMLVGGRGRAGRSGLVGQSAAVGAVAGELAAALAQAVQGSTGVAAQVQRRQPGRGTAVQALRGGRALLPPPPICRASWASRCCTSSSAAPTPGSGPRSMTRTACRAGGAFPCAGRRGGGARAAQSCTTYLPSPVLPLYAHACSVFAARLLSAPAHCLCPAL